MNLVYALLFRARAQTQRNLPIPWCAYITDKLLTNTPFEPPTNLHSHSEYLTDVMTVTKIASISILFIEAVVWVSSKEIADVKTIGIYVNVSDCGK
jgi:hypothetical protein